MMEPELLKMTADNLPVVTMDGDKFWLTILPAKIMDDLWTDMHWAEFPLHAGDLEGGYLSYEVTDTETIFYREETARGYHSKHIVATCNHGETEFDKRTSRLDTAILWRPVLIPLTKGQIPDISFSENNKDGDVYTGGYLPGDIVMFTNGEKMVYLGNRSKFLSGSDAPWLDSSVIPTKLVSEEPPKNQLYRDTTGPLTWWAYHGCLICTQNCFRTYITDLQKWGLLPMVGTFNQQVQQ